MGVILLSLRPIFPQCLSDRSLSCDISSSIAASLSLYVPQKVNHAHANKRTIVNNIRSRIILVRPTSLSSWQSGTHVSSSLDCLLRLPLVGTYLPYFPAKNIYFPAAPKPGNDFEENGCRTLLVLVRPEDLYAYTHQGTPLMAPSAKHSIGR